MPIGFHPFELIIILAIALLIFGPKKLPEMGASIGKSIKAFQKGMKEINEPDEPSAPAARMHWPVGPTLPRRSPETALTRSALGQSGSK